MGNNIIFTFSKASSGAGAQSCDHKYVTLCVRFPLEKMKGYTFRRLCLPIHSSSSALRCTYGIQHKAEEEKEEKDYLFYQEKEFKKNNKN